MAEFYSARGWEIPPLPWTNLSPPFSPVQAELDSAMKRIGELTMQVELLEAKTETFGPLGRRRSRR